MSLIITGWNLSNTGKKSVILSEAKDLGVSLRMSRACKHSPGLFSQNSRLKTPDSGLRTQDSKLQTQDSGFRTQDSGLRKMPSYAHSGNSYTNPIIFIRFILHSRP
ncbi:MAG TPA: hypothetical protein ENH10_00015 [Bacteroidetes bacterium]|nr:hypothetical protein [Bacteroidota bacterium]HEX03530.1 hypothetical protein [Bacteroidota bacterium]